MVAKQSSIIFTFIIDGTTQELLTAPTQEKQEFTTISSSTIIVLPVYPDRVETDLSDQKNGTSAENDGTCAPYPIIREPELRLPYD